jgi:hypothetical protein
VRKSDTLWEVEEFEAKAPEGLAQSKSFAYSQRTEVVGNKGKS